MIRTRPAHPTPLAGVSACVAAPARNRGTAAPGTIPSTPVAPGSPASIPAPGF